MAIEKVKKLAKKASLKEAMILEGLESYYKGECSLGYTASKKGYRNLSLGLYPFLIAVIEITIPSVLEANQSVLILAGFAVATIV